MAAQETPSSWNNKENLHQSHFDNLIPATIELLEAMLIIYTAPEK